MKAPFYWRLSPCCPYAAIDLTKTTGGAVYNGKPQDRGAKPADCTITMSDDDFIELASGRLDGKKVGFA